MTSKTDSQGDRADGGKSSDREPASNEGGSEKKDEEKIQWRVIVPIVLVGAVLLLVGLPIGAVWFMTISDCCLTASAETTITFWASMIAGFVALFGMLITGVFVVTAFRVDATARSVARESADKAVDTYIRRYKKKMIEEIDNAKDDVTTEADCAKECLDKVLEDVKAQAGGTKEQIGEAEKDVQAQADDAKEEIGKARADVERLQTEAADEMARAKETVATDAGDAQEQIHSSRQDVERRRNEAIEAIDKAQQEVNAAAEEARRAIADSTGEAEPEDEDDPR